MRYVRSFFIVLFFVFVQESALAVVEVRIHYGLYSLREPLERKDVSLSGIHGLGVDALVSPPLAPLTFGLRYEDLGRSESSSTGELEVDIKRVSILLSYSLIEALFFLRATGTVGILHDGKTLMKTDEMEAQRFDNKTRGSYSVGLEGGSKFLTYMAGAELGFLMMKDRGIEPRQKYDGLYGKIYVGLNF